MSGAVGTGLPSGPISSIAGDPNNPNRLYAAVTAPTASPAGNASTALFVSNDAGATWSQVFGGGQSFGTIHPGRQTILKIATGPGGAVAVGVIEYKIKPDGTADGSAVTGLFWSGIPARTGASFPCHPSPNLASIRDPSTLQ